MKFSYVKWKILFAFIILTTELVCLNGRRYDKCSTPDGREGVCVVKRYCRERTVHPLVPCDTDGNFCCPIPTEEDYSPTPKPAPAKDPTKTQSYDSPSNRHNHQPNNPVRSYAQSESSLIATEDDNDFESQEQAHSTYNRPGMAGGIDDTYSIPASESRVELRPQERPKYPDSVPPVVHKPVKNLSQEKPRRVIFPDPDEYYQRPPIHRPSYPKAVISSPGNPPIAREGELLPEVNTEEYENDRRISSMADSKETNRNPVTRPRPQVPAMGHYPARDQLEVQKLPSNPRRLKPLRYDVANETDISGPPHSFFAPEHNTPKVPSCGVKPYNLFIAGGETSEPFEWPWMTAIFRRHQGSKPKTFICGGSLINTKYVLTAAHCFVNNYVILPASSFVIRVGSNFLDSGEEYTVGSLVVHHNHSGSDFFNDIALLRVASEVFVTDKIAPICLPDPGMMLQHLVDRVATVAGWGDTTFRTGASRALQHVTVPIVSSEECFAAYSRVRGAAFLARGSDHVICAGLREGGKDACLGDSGGPLMLKTVDDRWTIVGIVSLGYKCAEPGYPGVYTRVTHYLSWIQENMKLH